MPNQQTAAVIGITTAIMHRKSAVTRANETMRDLAPDVKCRNCGKAHLAMPDSDLEHLALPCCPECGWTFSLEKVEVRP